MILARLRGDEHNVRVVLEPELVARASTGFGAGSSTGASASSKIG
jgi:hypothetical protein